MNASGRNAPDWLQELEHTADTGIIVIAPTLRELFSRAAWGMFSVITDMSTVQPRMSTEISVDAGDERALMVRWLSELNLQHVTMHWLFSRFDVSDLSDTHLRAQVYGEPTDAEHHMVHTEIKAITYHELKIENTGNHWKTQIIFDL